jgi:hypothetical protein
MSVKESKPAADQRSAIGGIAWWVALMMVAGVFAPFLPEAMGQPATEHLLPEAATSTAAISNEIGPEAGRQVLNQPQTGFSVAEIKGAPDSEIPVTVDMPKSLSTDYLIVSFRGVPEGFTFSSGFRTAENWFVAARQVQGLTLMPPPGFSGSFNLEAQLIRGQNIAPLVESVRVSIQRRPAVAKAGGGEQGDVGLPGPTPGGSSAELPAAQLDPARERQLLLMAKSLLQQKDIAAARLVYRRLAKQGSVDGTLLLAQTYDPDVLARHDISGLEPDTKEAKRWYELAAKLGSKDASGRLLALGAAERR